MNLAFKRASRTQVPLKLGLSGPSGSGKTTAALRLLRGLVGLEAPIALLDTENGSASLYSDLTAFDVLDMNPPYQVAKFTAAIDAAVQGGYKALIIDSASMEWQELLAEKEALDMRGGNSYANWGSITKKHEDFIKAIRNAPIHLVLCLRAKDKHEITEKDGKKSVVKLGQGSVMRDGFEYELTTVFDLAMDHSAKTSKDRTRLFDGRLEPVTEATGRELAAWLASGAPMAENTGEAFTPAAPAPAATAAAAPAPEPLQTRAPEPANPEAAFREHVADALAQPNPPVSQTASDFVDSIQPPEAEADPKQVDAVVKLLGLANKYFIGPDQLLAYAIKKGWATDAGWTTCKLEGAETLIAFLESDKKRPGLKAHLNAHHPEAA